MIIQDKAENTIYQAKITTKPVITPEVTFLLSSILSDNNARAEVFGNTLTISRPAAVKTGTSELYRDAWTIGYTPDIVVGVWVGNDDNSPMDSVAGSLGAAPIWKNIMEKYNLGRPVKEFAQPNGVIALSSCSASVPFSSRQKEFFIEGTQPQKDCYFPTPIQGLVSERR